jgi:hypothetical protein
MTDESVVIAKEKAALIELLLVQEEVHWQQRSRVRARLEHRIFVGKS